MSNFVSAFRLDTLTSFPLPVPKLSVLDSAVELDSSGAFLLFPDPGLRGPAVHPVDAPGEMVLRELFEVNASNVDSLIDFINQWGPITRLPNTLDVIDSVDPLRPAMRIEMVRSFILQMRTLVDAWAFRDEGPEALRSAIAVHDTFGFLGDDEVQDLPDHEITRRVAKLYELMGGALANAVASEFIRVRTAEPAPVSMDRFGVYEVAAVQLYNIIAEGHSIRICSNQKCGTRFVRQFGRAEYGQHRTRGVKYCSKECAKAQAQRDYMSRKRAKTKEGET